MWVFLRSYGLQNSNRFSKEKNEKKRRERKRKMITVYVMYNV